METARETSPFFIQRKFEVAFSTPEKYTVKKEKGDCLGIFTYR
jgi:hypothetical protein